MAEEQRRKSVVSIALIAVVLLLPVLYAASYVYVLDHGSSPTPPGFFDIHASPPEYRCGGDLAIFIFYPAHFLDRHWLRPNLWYEETGPGRFEVG